MNPQLEAAIGISIAALSGLAVGLEREWSGHAVGPRAHFAGIRTFTLLGLLGGMAGWMWNAGQQWPATALVAGAAALIVSAYTAAAREDLEGTTEVAALVVLAAALLAGMRHWSAAAAITAFTTLVLVEKSRIHAMVERLDDASLLAAARFAVMAVVILPILPRGPFGPWGGLEPRLLWTLVLFFSGLNFADYVARRAVGEPRADLLTGLLGGFVSSTAVTVANARQSHLEDNPAPLVSGALAACTVVFFRVLVATAVLNPALARVLALYLAAPALAGAIVTLLSLGRGLQSPAGQTQTPRNPLQLYSAMKMVLIFQGVFYAVYGLQKLLQRFGTVVSGALVGLVELDALIVSMSRQAETVGVAIAARAILMGLLVDASLKLIFAAVLGKGRYRSSMAAGLGCIMAALAITLLVLGS